LLLEERVARVKAVRPRAIGAATFSGASTADKMADAPKRTAETADQEMDLRVISSFIMWIS
jgi:hypothetical protein